MDNVNTIAVIGAGSLGVSLARTIAAVNYQILLIEKDPERAGAAAGRIGRMLDHDINKWRISDRDKELIMNRITVSTDIDTCSSADLVIEAIGEEFEAKQQLLKQLDKVCRPPVVFITTTATLSITRLGATLSRPDKLIGMIFQVPVERVPVVEVVSGLKTGETTRTKIQNFAAQLQKETISVSEYPGYVTTRILIPYLNEAMYVVMEGVANAADVDKALKLSHNFPQGPLAMADSIGLDTVLQWMEHLFHELGDLKYRPCPILRKLVNAGHLGVKTGEGFFKYDEE